MIESTVQQLFDNAKKITFLTGAGVSTPSGIPDYRSKNGLYTNNHHAAKPAEYYLSIDCLNQEPEVFYDFMMNNMYYPDAKPNVIHQKQAKFTKQRDAMVITQNIDGLYQKADTKRLVEFHGTLFDVYCLKCGEHVDYREYLDNMHHQNCGGILRPNIVLYGEGLAGENISRSIAAISTSDLIVIVGTSMKVYPFAGLIDYRIKNANVVVVNQEVLDLGFKTTMLKTDATAFFNDLQVN
ncbi:NAD-dependent protein deacylase [Lentilactobacillus kosonis]|uniref:protein acetyllysine N-acetyltransferase n=1 Tax=Lentilactobacillus kosonis TaxID=2810561 RepID=A0A401FPM1_9LACO|nr:NAD-dependent protein deacylase [Lentilactobacillus kosonis]GAY74218.1 NAD-dependent protein deacetylase of SIR2 family [Lentilactobacillus kosonis]